MARRHTALIAVALLALAHPSLGQERSPIEGVWQRVEVVMVTHQGMGSNTDLQPSLYIFTPQFFSVMYVDGAGPRPPRGPRPKSQLSPEEKIAEYDPFVSYSGTYDIRESRVTFYPQVSLNPSFMAGGFRTDAFALEGDVLWLIMRPQPGRGGPLLEIRTRLERLEGGFGGSDPGRLAN